MPSEYDNGITVRLEYENGHNNTVWKWQSWKQYRLNKRMVITMVRKYGNGDNNASKNDSGDKNAVWIWHYNSVIMSSMASQITSLTIVYSTVHSGADQRKHQSSASLAFVRGIHRWPVNSSHKWPVTRFKCFHLMTSPCEREIAIEDDR